MINKVNIKGYCRLSEIAYSNLIVPFELYVQLNTSISDDRDIYEFSTSRARVYVAAKTVFKILVYSLPETPITEFIENALPENVSISNIKNIYMVQL